MPRITNEARDARRAQILNAARACVRKHGLEAVSMEMIIARSGLSTGAVYRYFKGKDDIISAAIRAGTAGLVAALQPVVEQANPPALPELVGQILQRVIAYQGQGDVDLGGVFLHGWSHAQTHDALKADVAAAYSALGDQYAVACRRLQAAGRLAADVDPEAAAQLVQSICLGFMAQRALTGRGDVETHVRAVADLSRC